jgi:AcrR family transcriptional regulator
MKARTSKKKQQILDTAITLFTRDGYHATGVDRISDASGVTKRTLYQHFQTKDGLIQSALRRENEDWCDWFTSSVLRRATDPGERILAIFDVLSFWFTNDDFAGCSFLKAACEFPEPGDPILGVVQEHDRRLKDFVLSLVQACGISEPERLARALVLLISGAIVETQVTKSPDPAVDAKDAARVLLRAHAG